ncbi:MAG: hypothetical protein KDA91_18980 [Planctomycetaceae bacterium]|nr:hypothetical protein [Planctomycetaceae bacterium]
MFLVSAHKWLFAFVYAELTDCLPGDIAATNPLSLAPGNKMIAFCVERCSESFG